MEPSRVAFVYHLNLDHINLSCKQANKLMKKGLVVMLDHIQVPTNISSMGHDWELIELVNPELENSYLKVYY